MAPHSSIRIVRTRPAKFRWLMGCMVAILSLQALLPSVVHAQVILPVVINLPPSFLQSPPVSMAPTKAEPVVLHGVVKEIAGAPAVTSQIAAVRNADVRATELRGLLPHQFDHHYFGLEAAEPGGAFAVTLVVEPAAVLVDDAVNFVVLTEEGMKKFRTGADPVSVRTAIGSPLLFDQVGNRLTALVPGNRETRYTVVVYNNGKLPATYTLQVQGGVLLDEAGQTFSAVKVSAPSNEGAVSTLVKAAITSEAAPVAAAYEGIIKRLGNPATMPVDVPLVLQQLLPEPVTARRVSGELGSLQERHYLNLATDTGGGDITLTLHYQGASDAPSKINFWVMTQDGVRHLVQGALAQELNLATGLPVAGEPGVYQARLRMAENMLYTVVVFSESDFEADYTLSVQGGILVDRYGQTREAHAAEMEMLALASK
ncbi:MAG: hypothetical protein IT328_23155 [Caldilineaceae bacterium]|nr:hypothetical protein [Caldilineaceae bacterium]